MTVSSIAWLSVGLVGARGQASPGKTGPSLLECQERQALLLSPSSTGSCIQGRCQGCLFLLSHPCARVRRGPHMYWYIHICAHAHTRTHIHAHAAKPRELKTAFNTQYYSVVKHLPSQKTSRSSFIYRSSRHLLQAGLMQQQANCSVSWPL